MLDVFGKKRIYASVMHKCEIKKTKVAIVGARGYAGLELARLLLKHPQVELEACFAGESSFALSDYLVSDLIQQKISVLPLSDLVERLEKLDTVFLATPTEISMEWVPKILVAGKNVVDLSGAFRLKLGNLQQRLATYDKWYQMNHSCPELLSQSVYGLSPWNHKNQARPQGAALIANPGCYATAILMGVLPLLQEGSIDPLSLVIDAKSGTSGAGRKASENLLFTEVDGECLPYRVGKHQHLPEIQEHVHQISGRTIDPFFTTSLLPVRRGIIAGIYARLTKKTSNSDEIKAAFEKSYGNYPLIRFGALSELGSTLQSQLLSLKRISGTAKTYVFFEVIEDKLYLFSLIDNLLKGAASQAVENLNWLNNWPADMGLASLEGVL